MCPGLWTPTPQKMTTSNEKLLASNYLYLTSLLSGGVAGLVVDVVLFPIDTIKTRLQSEKRFWRAGGFRGIYNGLGPAAVGSVPSAALFFCTYESMKKILMPYAQGQHQSHIVHMSSAAMAEVVACLVRVPVEIAKQRRQVLSTQCHGSAVNILVNAYKSEGLFAGPYRGFGATILREIPFSFIQYPLWEYMKLHWTEWTGLPLTFVSVAICGAVAGGIAAAVTTPLDVAKTRIMLAERNGEKGPNAIHILRRIYSQNGYRGIFAGFAPRVLWITLGGAIFFGSYDLSTKVINKQLSSNAS